MIVFPIHLINSIADALILSLSAKACKRIIQTVLESTRTGIMMTKISYQSQRTNGSQNFTAEP